MAGISSPLMCCTHYKINALLLLLGSFIAKLLNYQYSLSQLFRCVIGKQKRGVDSPKLGVLPLAFLSLSPAVVNDKSVDFFCLNFYRITTLYSVE